MRCLVKSFQELSNEELYHCLQLRNAVFVVEQNCPYQDLDGLDEQAWHLLLFYDDMLAGYCRILPPGLVYENAAIGRVLIKTEFRKKGLGIFMMQTAITKTKELFENQNITISAQCYLIPFYRNLGFKSCGEEYLEDNIPHIKMVYISEK